MYPTRSSQSGQGPEEERLTAEAQRAQRRWRRPDKQGRALKLGAQRRVTQDTLRGDAGYCNAEKVGGKNRNKSGTE